MKLLTIFATLLLLGCGNSDRTVTVNAVDGQDGKDGESCLLSPVSSGYNLICSGTTVFIPDSGDLPDGAELIVGVSNPCGDDPAVAQDEILLITSMGEVFAYFENGSNRRLSILRPGVTYRTTDGGNCSFRIDEDGQYTYQSVIF